MILSWRIWVRVLSVLCAMAAIPAAAQSPPPVPSAPERPLARGLVARFNDANATHDGRLTLAQARASHLAWVARHFAEVDAGGKGYVTLADLQAYRDSHRGTAAAATPQPPPARAARPRFVDRFAAANVTGDGHLTLAQARAGHMPAIARHFAEIDTAGRGYVTLADIRSYRQLAARARPQGDAPPP
jgi:hypothetical protein